MSPIDLDKFLAPVSQEKPCGDNLEYDAAFHELDQAAQGKPEQQIGDTILPAEDPDWRRVAEFATAFLGRSKDLRAAVHLVRALCGMHGWPGLRDGLAVLRGLLEQHWDHLHPQLDPEDDFDPTLRMNTLLALAGSGQRTALLTILRLAPLVSSRAFGRHSLRNVLIATGQLAAAPGETVPDLAAIDAAFLDAPAEDLDAVRTAIEESLAAVRGIASFLSEKIGEAATPDFGPLLQVVQSARSIVADRLQRRGLGEGAAGEAAGEAPEGAQAGARGAASGPRIAGDVQSREDAIRVLDKVCEYFERTEPSSPVPILLRRAKRLVAKSFLEILQDLAPDGVAQARVIQGIDTEGS